MKDLITNKEFEAAQKRMNELLNIATEKGGFAFLTPDEDSELHMVSTIVNNYEDVHFIIGTPKNVPELITLKMFEKKLKQKEIAKLLHTSDTKLSEIMNFKSKPNVALLKSLKTELGVDGNLLLNLV